MHSGSISFAGGDEKEDQSADDKKMELGFEAEPGEV
jgi:hypothetical protein|tara:strand:+ start:704 stop:811 length:108 start_codon:yes stop_codon:yes gene_type:complete